MLTVKQARFVAEFARTGNATQSAITAGYSINGAAVTGSNLLRNTKVIAALQAVSATAREVVEAKLEEAVGSEAWIIEKAAEVVNRALNAVPVTVMQNGERVTVEGEWTCNLGAATPALALLARRQPAFSEKHDVNLNMRAQVLALVAAVSEDELRAAKARLA